MRLSTPLSFLQLPILIGTSFLFVTLLNSKLLQKSMNQEVIVPRDLSYSLIVYSPVMERNSEA